MDEAELKRNPFAENLYQSAVEDLVQKEEANAFSYDISKTIDGISVDEYENDCLVAEAGLSTEIVDDESLKEVEITSSMENVLEGTSGSLKVEYQFDVTVADPQSVSEGIGSYILYQVQLQTNCPLFASSSTVRRRYSDFDWLYNELFLKYEGYFVPIPPEKQIFGKNEEQFVERRRLGLESFLKKIAHHPVLFRDPSFKDFLQSASLKTLKSKRPDGNALKSIFRMLTGNAAAIDTFYESKLSLINANLKQLELLQAAVETLSRKKQELAAKSKRLTDCLSDLALQEMNTATASILTTVSSLEEKSSTQMGQLASADLFILGTKVDEYLRNYRSMKLALDLRSSKHARLIDSQTQLIKLREQYQKAAFQPAKTAPYKMEGLQRQVIEASDLVRFRREEFDLISMAIKEEFDRSDCLKTSDFKETVLAYLKNLSSLQKKVFEE